MSKQSHSNPELDNVLEAGRHTPAPWYFDGSTYVREQSSDYCLAHISDGGHIDIENVIPVEQQEANARLIAAAPDLLIRLERSQRSLEAALQYYPQEFKREIQAEIIENRAAIARATGEAV